MPREVSEYDEYGRPTWWGEFQDWARGWNVQQAEKRAMNETVVSQIKRIMAANGISMEALAARIEATPQELRIRLASDGDLNLYLMFKILKALGCTVDIGITQKSLGQIAYEAANTRNGKWAWSDMTDNACADWERAAQAVIAENDKRRGWSADAEG